HIQRIKDGAAGRDLLHEEKEKLGFLESVVISLEGMIRHAKRFAHLAKEMAEKEQDPQRKAELTKAAEVCMWVPENPARTFHEALQSIWFTVLGSFLDKTYANVFLGRTDQHLFPYYMADINEGRMTRQEAAELIGCFIMKLTELESYMMPAHRKISQGTNYENITIGGLDRKGRDASNEVSCMILHVAKETKTHQPYISLRYNTKLAPELLDKAFECARVHGGGIPAFFNDTVNIEYMLGRGHSIEDARDYGIAGCIEAVLPQCCGYARSHALYVNNAKVLELALHNGTDPRTGVKIGLETGESRDFKTFEKLKAAYKKQVDYVYNLGLDRSKKWYESGVTNDGWYFPFISGLLDGPIASGRDVTRQGTKVIIDDSDWCIDRQFQDTADSLLAIKKLVFEQKKYTMKEMIDAIDADFEGYEQLRADCLAQPKYGNDDGEADLLMSELWDYAKDIILSKRDVFGRKYLIFRNGSAAAAQAGKVTGALPNGRKSGEWLADAGLSPMQGMDQKGPTAVVNSATKMDYTDITGSLLNMKLCPSLVDKPGGMMKFKQLVRTYMDKGGQEVQFNILDKETLLDAQEHPENHRDLVVRVAGYSAFWVDLERQVQDEIIRRTEHEM
ncbi:pyruvate formate lyase family protein, partial [Chloroflexota bacterium]